MVFSDLFFLFVFLPSFLLCYLLATWVDRQWLSEEGQHSNKAKNLILVCFSLIFYAWGEPVYVFLMLFCVFVNYLVGLGIAGSEQYRKVILVIGLILNIAIIGTFKYLRFFAQCLCDMGIEVAKPNIALPIGISFYTFQSISYLVDVYRRESPVQRRFPDLLLYISMFPQLIAGPIVRYGTVADEIHNRHVNAADFSDGLYRFLIGLGKKVIIANQLSEISDQFLVNGLSSLTMAGAWIGIVAFTLQIYFDFSGYSDMAIGLGRCMGFHFNENFRHPYCCNSITDFWRRWHISLGSFSRLCLYPLRRQPQSSGCEHPRGMVPHRYVARSQLELHYLGCLFRYHRHVGEIHAAEGTRPHPCCLPAYLQHAAGHCRMGHFLFRQLRPDDRVLPCFLRQCPLTLRLRRRECVTRQFLVMGGCPLLLSPCTQHCCRMDRALVRG